ncbi:MAG: hypothetical protein ACRDJM_08300 [Actinomycetota bacterium]
MRIKLLVGALLMAAFASAPARADDVTQCTEDLPATVCAFVINTMQDGYTATFVGGEVIADGLYVLVFAGHEEIPGEEYAGTGACGEVSREENDYQCVVLFQYGEDNFVAIFGTQLNCTADPDAPDPFACDM